MEKSYDLIQPDKGVPIKAWTKGVTIEAVAEKQLRNVASMPFIYKWVAAMPDVHWGIGATVGSVIATKGAIIPAAVGVDIGCGMMAVQTTLNANQLPDSLKPLRTAIEKAVPHAARGARSLSGRLACGVRSNGNTKRLRKNILGSTAAMTSIISARWGPAIILSKCASMKAIRCGLCCTAARAV